MTTRTERFQRKPNDGSSVEPAEPEEVIKFSPEEEAVRIMSQSYPSLFAMISQSNQIPTHHRNY
jgi:hypothetical protein